MGPSFKLSNLHHLLFLLPMARFPEHKNLGFHIFQSLSAQAWYSHWILEQQDWFAQQ
jgi:hypothetical protein